MWRRLAPKIPDLRRCVGPEDSKTRRFIEAVLWIWRTGAPWRDLPEAFGKWFTAYQRFRRWATAGVWRRIYGAVLTSLKPDITTVSIDSTSIRVHQHAQATAAQAVGCSRGGRTTKLHAVVASDKLLVAWQITPGQKADIRSAPRLLRQARWAKHVLADRAYDADDLVASLNARGAEAVIPARRRRRAPRPLNKALYARRNEVERCFAHLKQFRRVATRYDKRAACFSAGILLVAAQYLVRSA